MDLYKAKLEAKSRTLTNKGKTIYINGSVKGDCSLSDKPSGSQTLMAFANGAEIPMPAKVLAEPKLNKNKLPIKKSKVKIMENTKSKKTTAKKASETRKPVARGPLKEMKIKEAILLLKKGVDLYTESGKHANVNKLMKRADKDAKKKFAAAK